jgi:hypothetical protein
LSKKLLSLNSPQLSSVEGYIKTNPHPIHSSPIKIISTAMVQHQNIAQKKILLSIFYKVCNITDADIQPVPLSIQWLTIK